VLGGVIVLLRAFWDVSGIDERLARDLTIHVALPALLAARFGGDIGWRIDRTAVRGAALFAAFVTPFYVVGSTLPTGREYCPMWTTALTVSPFLPHAVQLLVVAFAAETCYRGLLCVGVRDRGFRCVPISPGVYALMHAGKSPVELLQSGPTDVLFDAVDSVDGGPRLRVRSPGLPRVARPRPAARPRPRDTWLAPRPAPSALLTLYGNRGNLFFDGSRRGRMSFQLTAEHEAVREAVREFGAAEIAPVAREHDETGRYPEDIRRKAAELDLVSPHIPVEYGGAGMDAVGRTVVTEELWRADPGIGSAVGSAGFGSSMLLEYGDEWMKEEWLPRIASGESASCSCISEPGHGSNVAGMETTAERDGDGYVINGNKMWITNGTVADVAVVMAKTDPAADPPHRGITAFLVPTETDGFRPTKIDNKLGIRASDLAEIVLDDVRVPADNVVGTENEGFYQLMDFFASGRTSVAAQAVGAAQGALDAAVDYANEREQFGQKIGEFQAIEHKIAEMATNVEAARSLTYRAASHVEGDTDDTAVRLASMAKLFASEHAVDVADEALQVHGGAGYVSDHPVERIYRDARITKIYEGTSEIQKNIISDRVL
jgi:alkylation response protein AidB-like acyl-CoA dehydrogenase